VNRQTANPLVSDAHDDRRYYGQESRWQRGYRLVYDRTALALLGRGLSSGVRRLGWLGYVLHACGCQQPSRHDVAALFPDLSPRDAARVARQSAALRFRNRAAIASFRAHGLTGLARLVTDECAGSPPPVIVQRTGGLILLTFHIGAHFGVSAALTRWRAPVSTMRTPPPDDANVRARVLKHAVDTVRAGGIVSAVADGPGGASCEPVDCLGRQIVLRRGPLALARITGAPVVPMVARWTADGQIAAWAGAPLADASLAGAHLEGSAREQALAAAAANWLEQHLSAHPADIWPYTLLNLLGAPPVTP
jgi:hypothetical protein